jgi:hypothetical protein
MRRTHRYRGGTSLSRPSPASPCSRAVAAHGGSWKIGLWFIGAAVGRVLYLHALKARRGLGGGGVISFRRVGQEYDRCLSRWNVWDVSCRTCAVPLADRPCAATQCRPTKAPLSTRPASLALGGSRGRTALALPKVGTRTLRGRAVSSDRLRVRPRLGLPCPSAIQTWLATSFSLCAPNPAKLIPCSTFDQCRDARAKHRQ